MLTGKAEYTIPSLLENELGLLFLTMDWTHYSGLLSRSKGIA